MDGQRRGPFSDTRRGYFRHWVETGTSGTLETGRDYREPELHTVAPFTTTVDKTKLI